jgi:two-component system LytT family response regulator
MTNLKAIVVDEERLARVNLRRLLQHFPEIEIAGEACSCESALELIKLHNPKLVFLDIELRGESGFDLLESIDNSINVIFVTAYEKSAICTFKGSNFDYLTKPVNPERLGEAIERVKARENKLKSETGIFVPEIKKETVVNLTDHLSYYLTAYHNYC